MNWTILWFFLFWISAYIGLLYRNAFVERRDQLKKAIGLLASCISREQNEDIKRKYELLVDTEITSEVLAHFGGTYSELKTQLEVMKRVLNRINNKDWVDT